MKFHEKIKIIKNRHYFLKKKIIKKEKKINKN